MSNCLNPTYKLKKAQRCNLFRKCPYIDDDVCNDKSKVSLPSIDGIGTIQRYSKIIINVILESIFQNINAWVNLISFRLIHVCFLAEVVKQIGRPFEYGANGRPENVRPGSVNDRPGFQSGISCFYLPPGGYQETRTQCSS